jgi:N6-L-threonylcarbamoyladenine synthase
LTKDALGLGIDTTFDDTSVAILRGQQKILANLTLSQYRDHAEFGGVVPERAARKHLEVIHTLIEEACQKADVELEDLDYIAVSNLPGLLGALIVGVMVAKTLSFSLKIPLIGLNHVEAHPYAGVLSGQPFKYPILHLVVAGGHTLLMYARDHFDYEIVGRSIDDAAGECVDKVAKLFGYPMPGGPVVDRFALEQPGTKYDFPSPRIHEPDFDFSFSGLKTALLRFKEQEPEKAERDQPEVLACFFRSVTCVLIQKTFRALDTYKLERLSVSGGVAASKFLRQAFEAEAKKRGIELWYPPPRLCTDNAAMVTCLGSYRHAAGFFDDLLMDAHPNLLS